MRERDICMEARERWREVERERDMQVSERMGSESEGDERERE